MAFLVTVASWDTRPGLPPSVAPGDILKAREILVLNIAPEKDGIILLFSQAVLLC